MHAQIFILVVCICAVLGRPAPIGSKFNPAKLGGSLSKDQMSLLGHISFLGEFNNKEFFIVRDRVDQATARNNCGVVGLNLAKFEEQSELDFIYDVTSSDDDFSWTDAEVGSGVKYPDGSSVNSNIEIYGYTPPEDTYGLVIDRYQSATRLRVLDSSYTWYYLCYVKSQELQ